MSRKLDRSDEAIQEKTIAHLERLLAQCDESQEIEAAARDCGMTIEQFRKFTLLRIRNERGKKKTEKEQFTETRSADQSATLCRLKKERNIAVILCVVLLVVSAYFCFYAAGQRQQAQGMVTASSQFAAAEKNYVASINSNKYHTPDCTYAENILESNRVYYATEEAAREAGKSPCSACKP